METVALGGDWSAREKWWIYSLRLLYPIVANINDGGAGMAGYVHTAEARKIFQNFKHTKKTKARISAGLTGHPVSDETKALLSAKMKGKPQPKNRGPRAKATPKQVQITVGIPVSGKMAYGKMQLSPRI